MEKLAAEITKLHKEALRLHAGALAKAMEAGERLLEAKAAVPHGTWAQWLKTNCPELSARTAQLYMRLAKNAERLKNRNDVAETSVRRAIAYLTPTAPEPKPSPAIVTLYEPRVYTEPPPPPPLTPAEREQLGALKDAFRECRASRAS